LEVSWRPGDGPGMVHLAWRERGAAVQPPRVPGFGLRLVSSIVRQQLQGRLNQTWGGDGLTTEVDCRITA